MIVCGNHEAHNPGTSAAERITHHHHNTAQVRDCFMADFDVLSIEEQTELDDVLAQYEVDNGIEDRAYYEYECV